MTDNCENITFLQLRWQVVKMCHQVPSKLNNIGVATILILKLIFLHSKFNIEKLYLPSWGHGNMCNTIPPNHLITENISAISMHTYLWPYNPKKCLMKQIRDTIKQSNSKRFGISVQLLHFGNHLQSRILWLSNSLWRQNINQISEGNSFTYEYLFLNRTWLNSSVKGNHVTVGYSGKI